MHRPQQAQRRLHAADHSKAAWHGLPSPPGAVCRGSQGRPAVEGKLQKCLNKVNQNKVHLEPARFTRSACSGREPVQMAVSLRPPAGLLGNRWSSMQVLPRATHTPVCSRRLVRLL